MNSRFGDVSPEAQQHLDDMQEKRVGFILRLQDFAVRLAAGFSDEGDEGTPQSLVAYSGKVVGNAPWYYLEYRLSGAFRPQVFVDIENRFREFCANEPGCSFQDVVIGNQILKLSLVFREDAALAAWPYVVRENLDDDA